MIGTTHEQTVVLRLSDAEVEELIIKLAGTLEHRRKLIAAQPAMRNWSDHSHQVAGTLDGKVRSFSFSISDPRCCTD